jgi:hypothetical protein
MARSAHTPGLTPDPNPQHSAPQDMADAIAPTAGTADTAAAMGDPLGVVSSPAPPLIADGRPLSQDDIVIPGVLTRAAL